MSKDPQDPPLTTRELARLLHAFAHFLEGVDAPPAASTRRRRRGRVEVTPDPVKDARARQTLRRLGVLR
jgi:hypothetical protein